MVSRRALIIHFKNNKAIKDIEKYIDVEYVSKKFNYVIGYINSTDFKKNRNILNNLKGIKYIEDSKFETARFDFSK